MIYVGVVLLFMFAALLSDRIGVSECRGVCDMSLLGAWCICILRHLRNLH